MLKPANNLPQALSSFVGRQVELEELKRWLLAPSSRALNSGAVAGRLLTLTGPGGSGKSRLALEAVQSISENEAEFETSWVQLAGLVQADYLVTTVATALHLVESGPGSLLDRLIERLNQASYLLVLDNCEHLLAECAGLTQQLLAACPHLRILATSRQALQIEGESFWTVEPLPQPPVTITEPAKVSDFAAVQLFIERARAVWPSFELNAGNAATVADLCRRLDGLPLALELVAARVRLLSVEQIAARLETSLTSLTEPENFADLAHHRSLYTTVEWSYDLLSVAEQGLFRRLSVLSGSFTLEAAEAVGSGAELDQASVLGVLSRLIDKSLLQIVAQSNQQPGLQPQRHYIFLQTVRQFAAEKLAAAGETAVNQQRQADYFLSLVEQGLSYRIGAEDPDWLGHLASNTDNLRSVLTWTLLGTGQMEKGLRLGQILWRFWWRHGQLSEGLEWLKRLIAHSNGLETLQTPATQSAKVSVLYGAGWLAYTLADYEAAFGFNLKSLNLAKDLDHISGMAMALKMLGNIKQKQGDIAAARNFMEQSLSLRREIGDQAGLALTLSSLADLSAEAGAYQEAQSCFEECLDIQRKLGLKLPVAMTLGNLGGLAYRLGHFETARAYFEESLLLHQTLNDRRGMAANLNNLGQLELVQDNYEQAEPFYRRALELLQELGNKTGIVIALNGLAEVAVARLDYAVALDLNRESLRIRQQLQAWRELAYNLETLARLLIKLNQSKAATSLLGAAHRLRITYQAPLSPFETIRLECLQALARRQCGQQYYEKSWQAFDTMTIEQIISQAFKWQTAATVKGWLNNPTYQNTNPDLNLLPHDEVAAELSQWPEKLSEREMEILRLTAQGLSTQAVARQLVIATSTVKWHLSNIYGKLGVHSRTGAVARARQLGLV